MAEELRIHAIGKAERYKELLPQMEALIGNERDEVANMANMSAALRQAFGFFWVGFYRVKETELVLGPFQGPIACTRIRYGKGVCGTAWKERKTLIVPDVELFPGHIACNSASKSEIVVPFEKEGEKEFLNKEAFFLPVLLTAIILSYTLTGLVLFDIPFHHLLQSY